MKIKKGLISAVILVLFFALNSSAQAQISKDEYSIYATVLKDIYSNLLKEIFVKKKGFEFVIINETLLEDPSSYQIGEPIELEPILVKQLRKLAVLQSKSGIGKNYNIINSRAFNLKAKIPIRIKYTLTSKSEIEKLLEIGRKEFQEEQKKRKNRLPYSYGLDWKYFYKRYPNAHGYYKISRVGFNQKRNLAQVKFVGNGAEWDNRITYILKNIKGKWHIETSFGGIGIS